MYLAAQGKRLERLARQLDATRRYVDLGIRLAIVERVSEHERRIVGYSPIYGGRWDRLRRRYVGPAATWSEIEVTREQFAIVESVLMRRNSYTLVGAGRGSGKSYIAAIILGVFATMYPVDGRGMVLAPTSDETSAIWDTLTEELDLGELIVSVRQRDRVVVFATGARVRFSTADALRKSRSGRKGRGKGNHLVLVDERQGVPQRQIESTRLTMRLPGGFHECQIGTPDMASEFFDEHNRFAKLIEGGAERYATHHMTSFANAFVPHTVFEDARETMDELFYRQEVLAEWIALGQVVYHRFDRVKHVRDIDPRVARTADYTEEFAADRFGVHGVEYLIGLDYNVEPMVAVVAKVFRDGTIYACDEVVIRKDADASRMATLLAQRGYGRAIVFDDASGAYSSGGRSSSAEIRKGGFTVLHRKKNPNVRDRVNAVNAKLETASGVVGTVVSPRCKTLIESLEQQRVSRDGKPDKLEGKDHAVDAWGYLINFCWPVRWSYAAQNSDEAAADA